MSTNHPTPAPESSTFYPAEDLTLDTGDTLTIPRNLRRSGSVWRYAPDGIFANQAIGLSTDKVHRANGADVRYLRNVFPSGNSTTLPAITRPTWRSTDSALLSNPPVSAARTAATHDGAGSVTTTPPTGPTPSPSTTTSATAQPAPWSPAPHCAASYYLRRSGRPLGSTLSGPPCARARR